MAASFEKVLEDARRLSAEDQEKLVRELREERRDSGSPPEGTPRTLFDALSERGIIGSITDAPPDLSTNPKYMEGFGQHAQ